MSYLMAADLHLKPETADTVFEVLERFTELGGELDVQTLVILGDIYDVRYHVPIELQNRLLDWVATQALPLIILPGNHDQESASGRNALEVFHTDGSLEAQVMTYPQWNQDGLWLPYRRDVMELVRFIEDHPRPDTCANVAWLHHGVIGALMNNHVVAGDLDGIHPKALASFDTVFAGHWHRHQEVANVVYVGSPWQVHADEAGQEKGFVWMDDDGWEHVPVHIGRRHHRLHVGSGDSVDSSGVQPGDVVHVVVEDEADSERVAAALNLVDVEVRIAPPAQEFDDDRLGLGSAATAAETARAFAAANHNDLDLAALLGVFAEVTS